MPGKVYGFFSCVLCNHNGIIKEEFDSVRHEIITDSVNIAGPDFYRYDTFIFPLADRTPDLYGYSEC
jgi:hypothetical protein